MLSFNKKRYKTKKIIFITAIITGSILLSTIFSVVFIVLDPKKQKKNINDFHFNTELNIRDFNPSDELLTNEFKRVNNNILKTWDNINFFWSDLSSTSASLILDASNSKIYRGLIDGLKCQIPLIEKIDIHTIIFNVGLPNIQYQNDSDNNLTLSFQNINDKIIDWYGFDFTWSNKDWDVETGSATLYLSASDSSIYSGTLSLNCLYTDESIIPKDKMIFSSDNSKIMGFNVDISGYNKFIAPIQHSGTSVYKISGNLFNNNESIDTINLQNITEVSDELGDAFTGCSNIREISIAPTNTGIKLWNGLNYNQTSISDGFAEQITDISDDTIVSVHGLACGDIVLPNGITKIEDFCFSGCKSIKAIDLNNVSTIGREAFNDNSSVEELSLKSIVSQIDSSAFKNCFNIRSLKFIDFDDFPNDNWENDIFNNWGSDGNVYAINGTRTSEECFYFAIAKGLPTTWFYV